MEGELRDCPEPVVFLKVHEALKEPFWNHLAREYHHLLHDNMIGRRVKHPLFLRKRLAGAMSYCKAAYKLGSRDLFLGWDEKTRLEHPPHLFNNNSFLILPRVKARGLASRILCLIPGQAREDWTRRCGPEPHMAETFVDPGNYPGTSRAAANWICPGAAKGLGRAGNSLVFHGN